MNAYPNGFPPIDELLPHRGTMQLLSQVLAYADETLSASAQVDGTAWYADADGAMPAWIGIELMAQAIAAHVALRSRLEGKPMQPGVLLGARRLDIAVQAFASDTLLRIDVHETIKVDGGHGAYDCAVRAAAPDSPALATAVVKVYQPDNFQQFMQGSLQS
jgi:predicted hotdog family 3-hydroxylacyl-ACP dehydratase